MPPAARVAVLATGTGAFLVDLAKQCSRASQFHGYDISDSAFLRKDQLPANVSLSLTNALETPRPEVCGTYDLVCIRLLDLALRPETGSDVAAHAAALLKPGGALQWIEGDLWQLCNITRPRPEVEPKAMQKLHGLALNDVSLAWFKDNLEAVLADAGFVGTLHAVSSSDTVAEERPQLSELTTGATYAIMRKRALSEPRASLGLADLDELREETQKEINGGAYVRMDMHQFIAWEKA